MKIYAVIDATNAPDLFDKVAQYDPPIDCLFNAPVQDEVKAYAPYLVELNVTEDPFKEWLWSLEAPWGIFLVSGASFIELRKHLRHYTYARIPTEEKPVYFRYYDPRTIWNLCSVIDDWQLHTFMGPIELIATHYEGEFKEAHFSERRENYPKGAKKSALYLTLNESQYAALNRFSEEKYIEELSEHMWSFIDPSIYENPQPDPDTIHREMLRHERDVKGVPITHPLDQQLLNPQPYFVRGETDHHWLYLEGETTIEMDHVISQMLNNIGQDPLTKEAFKEAVDPLYHGHLERVIEENRLQEKVEENPRLTKEELRAQINQFARDFVYFGKEQGITDNRSYKSLSELFIKNSIHKLKDLPYSWKQFLEKDDLTGKQKVNTLILRIVNKLVGKNNEV